MTTEGSGAERLKESRPSLSVQDKIQLWQHFISTAGADKNRMITMATWFLALSAGIIGYVVTERVGSAMMPVLSVLGMLVSIFALYIVWLYWVHEKWNRGKAECLVRDEPALIALMPHGDRPKGGAWVFGLFLVLAASSLLVHTGFFVSSSSR